MAEPIINNSKDYSCWNCDKFQTAPIPPESELYAGNGECRAIPPAQCCSVDETEPIFAEIYYGPYTWCAAWKRNTGEVLPDPADYVPPQPV